LHGLFYDTFLSPSFLFLTVISAQAGIQIDLDFERFFKMDSRLRRNDGS